MPIVSLCIPTYNGERYLREALTSACAQTVGDIEILIVDDGSSDGTIAIVDQFARHDPRVVLHRNANQMGLPGNWDRARELAKGKWIAFLFQDDLAKPQYLERMLAAAAAAPAQTEVVCCRREFLFDENTDARAREVFVQYARHDFSRYFPSRSFVSAEEFSAQLLRTPMMNFVGEPTAVMLGADTLARFGRFHTSMRQIVDLEYWARVATVTGIAYADEPLVQFRVHARSATSTNRNAAVRMDRADSIVFLHDMLTKSCYARLRRSPVRLMTLLRHYCARMYQIRPNASNRAPAEPSWDEIAKVYAPLRQPTRLQRLALGAYTLWRAVRN